MLKIQRSDQMGYATSFWMSLWPRGKKIIFLDFSGLDMQIEGRQKTISTMMNCSGAIDVSLGY